MRSYVTRLEVTSSGRNIASVNGKVARLQVAAQRLGFDVQHVQTRGDGHDERAERPAGEEVRAAA